MDTIMKLNEQLLGAPGGVLLAAFAIALGYLLKTLPFVPNKYIPLVVVVVCTFGFMLVAPSRPEGMVLRIYLTRNFIIGFIIGFAAWACHAQLLRRFVDPKLFPEDSSGPERQKPEDKTPDN